MIYTDPQKRHDFVFLFDVLNGNPNGDPDAGNLPRIDPETMHGLVTDVCLKRKVRDYVATIHQKPIFIQSLSALNTLIEEGFQKIGVEPCKTELDDEAVISWFSDLSSGDEPRGFTLEGQTLKYAGESTKENDIKKLLQNLAEEVPKEMQTKLFRVAKALAAASKGGKGITKEERGNARHYMLQTYYDIRMFGAVLSTGLNAGQVRGPMQLTFARSQSEILPLDLTITRQARTTVERMETGSTEIGRKPLVPYGLYRAHGFFNPYLAQQTGVQAPDLEIFWEALQNMFEYDRSAARGEMACRGLYIFTHDDPKGKAPAHKLFDLIKVTPRKDIPRQFSDYEIARPDSSQIADGVTLSILEG